MEYSYIYLDFNNDFQLQQIPDDVIVIMLDSFENKLLRIQSNKYFIVIRGISNDSIWKYRLQDFNEHSIEAQ